jgi:hypothetical protein
VTWRYQTTWVEQKGERTYFICEVYLDESGRLASWVDNPEFGAKGDTWDDLQRDLGKMYEDCWNWQPVALAELRVGMIFQRRERPPEMPAENSGKTPA